MATIAKVRPDVLKGVSVREDLAIPEEMPPRFLEKRMVASVADIGQPSTACFLTRMNTDPIDWWMFEKYDGVRGFWNPSKRAFYSRWGTQLSFPQEVIDAMPTDVYLDGEIWYAYCAYKQSADIMWLRFGRDNFQEAMKVSTRADPTAIDWTKLKYMVYDIPNHFGIYEERYKRLGRLPLEPQKRG